MIPTVENLADLDKDYEVRIHYSNAIYSITIRNETFSHTSKLLSYLPPLVPG